jgi:hypothetical protein
VTGLGHRNLVHWRIPKIRQRLAALAPDNVNRALRFRGWRQEPSGCRPAMQQHRKYGSGIIGSMQHDGAPGTAVPGQASAIPVIDVRHGGPAEHARRRIEQALALRAACLGLFPTAVRRALPLADRLARRSLERSRSPYLAEIARIAEILDYPGVWLLNASYQLACTSLARDEGGVPWLVRTLDWPFHGLGRHVEVAHMRGPSGEFFSITWPGYVGALTAMAPSRFAACINQAPLRRRFRHRWLRSCDIAANAIASLVGGGRMPPDQLLRLVFESCDDFATARRTLESIPVARPVIFTLVGCAAGERCVIERTETGCVTRESDTGAANDWVPDRPGWEGRIGLRRFLTSTYEQAKDYSCARRETLTAWRGALDDRSFAWVGEPVLNPYTRIAAALCPAHGTLRVLGYEQAGAELPVPATQVCDIEAAAQVA